MKVQILPSLLAADLGHLADEARRAQEAGADALHIDIMDAHFVPNLSFGPATVEMARKCVSIPLSVHLMMAHPDQYINEFVKAGSDTLFIHIEAECDVPGALGMIESLGTRRGITINPESPGELVLPVLKDVDEVLCMTVHPGYGGQAFMPEVLPKIRMIRNEAKRIGNEIDILVDGGINTETAVECSRYGANCFVAGTYLYRAADMKGEVSAMRRRIAEAIVL